MLKHTFYQFAQTGVPYKQGFSVKMNIPFVAIQQLQREKLLDHSKFFLWLSTTKNLLPTKWSWRERGEVQFYDFRITNQARISVCAAGTKRNFDEGGAGALF